jgi:prepilin-type N-terminal cleavage/methylation domain-containing protein
MLKSRKTSGFTLIEILVVVALIAILAAITFIAINPNKNFADARNTARSSDVREILNAITQYTAEQNRTVNQLGTVPTCPGFVTIGTQTDNGNINLATNLVPSFIVGIPKDPSIGSDAMTGYVMCQESGRVTVSAPSAENGKIITVKR